MRRVTRACVADARATITTLKVAARAASTAAQSGARILLAARLRTAATFKSIAGAAGAGLRRDVRQVRGALALVRQAFGRNIAGAGKIALRVANELHRSVGAMGAGLGAGACATLRTLAFAAAAALQGGVRITRIACQGIVAILRSMAWVAKSGAWAAAGAAKSAVWFAARTAKSTAWTAGAGLWRGVCAARNAVAILQQAIKRMISGAGWIAVRASAELRRGMRDLIVTLKRSAARRRAASSLAGVTFEVVSGLHGGVLLMLERGEYRIGSTADADIVLRDPGVVPAHAMLGIHRGEVRVEATGGDVGVGDQTISRGQGCRLKLPLDLILGEACLRLAPVESRSPNPMRWALAGAAVCCAVVIALLTVGWLPHAAPEAAAGPAPIRVASSAALAAITSSDHPEGEPDHALPRAQPAKPGAEEIDKASQELTARIKAANIRNLRVTVAQGRLSVSGLLSRRDAPAWSEIQQWFDQTYRGRLVLTTNFSVGDGPAMPVLQLRAAWFGERPYVITADGARFYGGAHLDNGWVLQEIGEDGVVLAKDGDTARLPYR